jgi:hypothetical protein
VLTRESPSAARVSSGSTRIWVFRSRFPFRLGWAEWDAGHAPAGNEYSTRSTRCLPTQVRARGCAIARNEYSGEAATPAHHIDFAGYGLACPARP